MLSIREANRWSWSAARSWARRAGELRQIRKLEVFVQRAERVAEQIRNGCAATGITDRLVSIFDPGARPTLRASAASKGFRFATQICVVTESTKTGARGLIVPATSQLGDPQKAALLPQTVAELQRLEILPREVALDGGFNVGPASQAPAGVDPERTFITGRHHPGSKRTQRRLAR